MNKKIFITGCAKSGTTLLLRMCYAFNISISFAFILTIVNYIIGITIGGAMGYFDSNGQMDTCIALRTGLVKNNKLIVQSGGGIVYDSNSEKEYQETINKAKALIKAAEESYKYENN